VSSTLVYAKDSACLLVSFSICYGFDYVYYYSHGVVVVNRILVNQQFAAQSKERKARYIQELERKVQTL